MPIALDNQQQIQKIQRTEDKKLLLCAKESIKKRFFFCKMTSGLAPVERPQGVQGGAPFSAVSSTGAGRRQQQKSGMSAERGQGTSETAPAAAAAAASGKNNAMTFDEFINGTSIHGVRYIFDRNFFAKRRYENLILFSPTVFTKLLRVKCWRKSHTHTDTHTHTQTRNHTHRCARALKETRTRTHMHTHTGHQGTNTHACTQINNVHT